MRLHVHAVNCAHKLVKTRQSLEIIAADYCGSNPPVPHDSLSCPS